MNPLAIALLVFAASATLPLAYWRPHEMGVWSCTMQLQTAAFDGLQWEDNYTYSTFSMHLLLRYMHTDGKNARIQGIVTVDPPFSRPGIRASPSASWDPRHASLDPKLQLRPLAAGADSIPLKATMKLPLGPIVQSALTGLVLGHFSVPNSDHRYELTALDGGKGHTCSFLPADLPNRLDVRGIKVDPQAMVSIMPTESTVIIKPLYNFNEVVVALVLRHLEHYAMLGFQRQACRIP